MNSAPFMRIKKKQKKNESKNDYMKNTFLSPAHKYNVQNYVKNKNVISYY